MVWSMVKLLLIPSALSLALGALLGYHLEKLESQQITKQAPESAIAAIPKQIDLRPRSAKRSELELKYALCTDSKPNPATLSRLDDKTLNDLVYQVCTLKS
jgi:hypothetical protein